MCIEPRHEATAETSFHMPDRSPLWRSMQVARPPLHAEVVGLDDRIVEQLVEAEVPRLQDVSSIDHALEVIQNPPVVPDCGEDLRCVAVVVRWLVHVKARRGLQGLAVIPHCSDTQEILECG
jgi:hypothetical protein